MTANKNSTRYFSSKQESHIAKELGGKRVSNSGATKFNKGDVELSDWLIEAKTCTKPQKSFVLKKEWFSKNREECLAMGKNYSAIAFDFGDGEQRYVISEKLFKRLVNYMMKDEE